MNCREIEELAPLYLSGELEDDRRAPFREHLAQCRTCTANLDRQYTLDARLRDALSIDLPDATGIQQSVRGRIAVERAWKFAAVAAVALFAAILGYRALRPAPVAKLYADAALDHRVEVMEHQPRRWRTDPADIEKLAARYQLSNLASLAPEGYRLEHAKMCGIDGKPALHLVYANGGQEVSVFVRARGASERDLRVVRVGSEQVAAFQTGRLEGVVVAAGLSEECLEFARFVGRAI